MAIKGVAPPREGVDAAIIIGTAGGAVRLLDKGKLRMSNMKLVIFAGFDDDAPYDVSVIFEGVEFGEGSCSQQAQGVSTRTERD